MLRLQPASAQGRIALVPVDINADAFNNGGVEFLFGAAAAEIGQPAVPLVSCFGSSMDQQLHVQFQALLGKNFPSWALQNAL